MILTIKCAYQWLNHWLVFCTVMMPCISAPANHSCAALTHTTHLQLSGGSMAVAAGSQGVSCTIAIPGSCKPYALSVDVSFCVLTYGATFSTLCQLHQDMKERHEKETTLKAERDVLAKDAANKQAADQASFCDICNQHPVASAYYTAVRHLTARVVQHTSRPAPGLSCKTCDCLKACISSASASALESFKNNDAAGSSRPPIPCQTSFAAL